MHVINLKKKTIGENAELAHAKVNVRVIDLTGVECFTVT